VGGACKYKGKQQSKEEKEKNKKVIWNFVCLGWGDIRDGA